MKLLFVFAPMALVLTFASEVTLAKPLAIVTNGAISVWSNHGRYYRNIKSAGKVLTQWQVANLAADGPGSQAPNSLNHDEDDRYVYDSNGLPIPSHFEPEMNYSGPATYSALVRTLAEGLKQVQPGEPVLLYFTDHGGKGGGPEDRKVCLWGENLSVPQVRTLVAMVPKSSKVILINDQCYGGGMLEAMWLQDEPKANACGFAAATTSQLAFGGGGFMRSIEAHCSKAQGSSRGCTFFDVYRSLLVRNKWKKQSTPISSSDLFLEKVTRKSRAVDPQGGVMVCGNRLERIADPRALSSLHPTLKARLQHLKTDLEGELGVLHPSYINSTNVCQKVSDRLLEELRQKIQKEERVLEDLHAEMNNVLRPKLRAAILDGWLKEKGNPELYQAYSRLKANLTELNQLRKRKPVEFGSTTVDARIYEVKTQLEPFEYQINLYLAAVKEGNPFAPLAQEFISYVKNQCLLSEQSGCPMSNILEEVEDLEHKISMQTANLVPAWKFLRDLSAVRGVQTLMAAGSQEELNQYTAILECEQTRVL